MTVDQKQQIFNLGNVPVCSRELMDALTKLATGVDTVKRENIVRLADMQKMGENIAGDVRRVETLSDFNLRFEGMLNNQLANQKRQIEVVDQRKTAYQHQINEINRRSEYVEVLNDNMQIQTLNGAKVLKELSKMTQTQMTERLVTALEKEAEIDISLEKQSVHGFLRLQYAGGGKEGLSPDRKVAIVASLVFVVGSACLLPFASTLGSLGIGAFYPGFKYAKDAKNEGEHKFSGMKFIVHILVGGITQITISKLAAPCLKNLGQKIAGIKEVAGIIGANAVTNITAEVMGQVVSQAILNASGLLLKKALMYGSGHILKDPKIAEKLTPSDIIFAMVAGSCGAAAGFGFDKIAFQVETALERVFVKGIAGFVQQAAAVYGEKACRNQWNIPFWKNATEEAFYAGLEGFFWALVYQAADEIEQKMLSAQDLSNLKAAVSSDIHKDKNLSNRQKQKLIDKINAAKSLSEINDILNKSKLKIQIAAIHKKHISPEEKKKRIDALKNKDPGLHKIIKNIYVERFNSIDLPKGVKDKLLKDIGACKTPDQLNKVIDEALNAVVNEIELANVEGKTWNEAKVIVKEWVKDLINRNYHPSGEHLPKRLLKNDLYVDDLTDLIMKGTNIKWTHHHHIAYVHKVGNQLIELNDGCAVKNKKFDHDIIEPKRNIVLLRQQRDDILKAKDDCDKNAKEHNEIIREGEDILKEPINKVNEAAIKLPPQKMKEVVDAFGVHLAAVSPPNLQNPNLPQPMGTPPNVQPTPIAAAIPVFVPSPAPVNPQMPEPLQQVNLPKITPQAAPNIPPPPQNPHQVAAAPVLDVAQPVIPPQNPIRVELPLAVSPPASPANPGTPINSPRRNELPVEAIIQPGSPRRVELPLAVSPPASPLNPGTPINSPRRNELPIEAIIQPGSPRRVELPLAISPPNSPRRARERDDPVYFRELANRRRLNELYEEAQKLDEEIQRRNELPLDNPRGGFLNPEDDPDFIVQVLDPHHYANLARQRRIAIRQEIAAERQRRNELEGIALQPNVQVAQTIPVALPIQRGGRMQYLQLPIGATILRWQRDIERLKEQIAECPNTRAGRARRLHLQFQ